MLSDGDGVGAHFDEVAVVAGDGVHLEDFVAAISSWKRFHRFRVELASPRAATNAVTSRPRAVGSTTTVVPRMTPLRSSFSIRSATAGRESPTWSASCEAGVRPSRSSRPRSSGRVHQVRRPCRQFSAVSSEKQGDTYESSGSCMTDAIARDDC